jgi:integrase
MSRRRSNGEGTVTKRADGRYMARLSYVDPITGQRQRATFYDRTAKGVRAKLKDARDRLEAQAPPKDATRSVAAWLTHWRATTLVASDRKPATRELYGSLCRKHLEPEPFGALTLDRLRPSDIEALVLALRDKKLSGSTIRSVYTVLRAALDGAVRDGLLARNPAALVKRPGIERREARHLPADEVSAVLRAAEGSRYHPALLLMAGTGLRRGECLALRWDAVDLDGATVSVTATLGRIGGELVISAPKTARSRRVVPLHPGIVAMLKRHKVAQAAERLRAGDQWQDSRLVFCTELGTPVEPRNLLRVVESAAKTAGVEGIGVHTLRHSAAVAWLEHGVHIKAVADLLGHSSISVTGDVYGHTSDDTARSAVESLGGRLGL